MAEVKLPKGILAISGRIGDMVFRTINGKTFVHYQPKRRKGRRVISRKRLDNDSIMTRE